MLDAETPDGGGVVIAYFLLLGVEAHALPDDLFGRAGRAPDGEGTFETHGKDSFGLEFAGAGAEGGAFAGGLVEADGAFEVGGDVAPHVEALHSGGELLKILEIDRVSR